MLTDKQKREISEALKEAIEEGRVIAVGEDYTEGHNDGGCFLATGIDLPLRRLEAEIRIVKAIVGREHLFDRIEEYISDIRYLVDNPPSLS